MTNGINTGSNVNLVQLDGETPSGARSAILVPQLQESRNNYREVATTRHESDSR